MLGSRVHWAAKLFSNTMANCIRLFFQDDSTMQELADFIDAANNWFDTLNSSKNWHPLPHKQPFGKSLVSFGPHSPTNYLVQFGNCICFHFLKLHNVFSKKSLENPFPNEFLELYTN